jgi:hypothetical protein
MAHDPIEFLLHQTIWPEVVKEQTVILVVPSHIVARYHFSKMVKMYRHSSISLINITIHREPSRLQFVAVTSNTDTFRGYKERVKMYIAPNALDGIDINRSHRWEETREFLNGRITAHG